MLCIKMSYIKMLCMIYKIFLQWIKLPSKNWPAAFFPPVHWFSSVYISYLSVQLGFKNSSLVPTILQAMCLKRCINPSRLTSNALYVSCLEQILSNKHITSVTIKGMARNPCPHTFTGHEFTYIFRLLENTNVDASVVRIEDFL